jgi:hypothetical protein
MWDALARRHSFSLLCGYPAGSVTRAGHLDAFAEVCRVHREVAGLSSAVHAAPGAPGSSAADGAAGATGAVRAFAFSRDAPAASRHFAAGELRRLDAADLADDAALVVTELAANAIVHAHSGFTLDLSLRPDALRISVRDAGPPGMPRRCRPRRRTAWARSTRSPAGGESSRSVRPARPCGSSCAGSRRRLRGRSCRQTSGSAVSTTRHRRPTAPGCWSTGSGRGGCARTRPGWMSGRRMSRRPPSCVSGTGTTRPSSMSSAGATCASSPAASSARRSASCAGSRRPGR